MKPKTINTQKLNGKLFDTNHSPFIKQTVLPVIKIDEKGNIIYANQSGLNVIHDLGCTASKRLPKSLFDANPELLLTTSYTVISILVKDKKWAFSVVGFPEDGYIGFYGLENETLK